MPPPCDPILTSSRVTEFLLLPIPGSWPRCRNQPADCLDEVDEGSSVALRESVAALSFLPSCGPANARQLVAEHEHRRAVPPIVPGGPQERRDRRSRIPVIRPTRMQDRESYRSNRSGCNEPSRRESTVGEAGKNGTDVVRLAESNAHLLQIHAEMLAERAKLDGMRLGVRRPAQVTRHLGRPGAEAGAADRRDGHDSVFHRSPAQRLGVSHRQFCCRGHSVEEDEDGRVVGAPRGDRDAGSARECGEGWWARGESVPAEPGATGEEDQQAQVPRHRHRPPPVRAPRSHGSKAGAGA